MSIKKKSPFSEKKASFYCLILMHFNALKFNFELGRPFNIKRVAILNVIKAISSDRYSQKARSLGF